MIREPIIGTGKSDNNDLGIMDPEGQEHTEGTEVDMGAWERSQLLTALQRVKIRQEKLLEGSHFQRQPLEPFTSPTAKN